jgi:hypothetical protein
MVTALIDPNSRLGLPMDQERLLHELRFWMTNQRVLKVMLMTGMVTPKELKLLGVRVNATDADDSNLRELGLDLQQTLIATRQFLLNRQVRMQIAREAAGAGRFESRAEAMKALWDLLKDIQESLPTDCES